MERWYLGLATLVVALAGALGARAVHRGSHSPWTVWLMGSGFAFQLLALGERGRLRGQCPLGDTGEILLFLAWSLILFYLLVGPVYRISLLGLFTAPVVVVFHLVALAPGVLTTDVVAASEVDPWRETHAATSVLSYGAFALAAVAGIMFIVLNRQLKHAHLNTGLFRNLPPASSLIASMVRLVWIGLMIMTVGMVSGYRMTDLSDATHLNMARGVWLAYLFLMVLYHWRGFTPRRFSVAVIFLFVCSLGVFAFL